MADNIWTYNGRIPTLGGGNRIPYFDKPSFVGLLDDYPNSYFAFSLRRLSGTYEGDALIIRRSSDSATQSIGFDTNGDLDTAAITSFVGANSAYVTTWYDQSGNGRNATQTTEAQQPRIVNTGTIDTVNGKTAIYFGTNANKWSLLLPTGLLNGATTLSFFNVANVVDYASSNTGIFGAQWFTGGSPVGLEVLQVSVISRPTLLRFNGTARNDNAAVGYRLYNNNSQSICEIYGNSTSTSAYNNNTSVTLTDSSAMPALTFNGIYSIGAYYRNDDTVSYSMNGSHQELITYTSNQTSNRTGIVGNINGYYGAY